MFYMGADAWLAEISEPTPDIQGYVHGNIHPPVGTLPKDTNYFEPITNLDTFIAYDQLGD